MRLPLLLCGLLAIYPQSVVGDPFSLFIDLTRGVLDIAETVSDYSKEGVVYSADLVGGAVMFGTGALYKFRDQVRCKLYECCDAPYIEPNFHAMKDALQRDVFGQHMVIDTVWNAVMAHWKVKVPVKPLVMSFHGYTGSGKNHVARIIVDHIFKNGMKSAFVHHIVATSEYPDKSRMEEYQLKLRERILNAAQKCERSVFIFDEVDKLPQQLLASIKPFLDYYDNVRGVDFRRIVFIFLSNQGGETIARITTAHHQASKIREDLTLKNFEGPVMTEVFNKEGGFQMSDLISNHLIDHFVPFLPLERQHVVRCTQVHLKLRNRADLASDQKFVDKIVDSLQYFPKGSGVFSSSGCKRVAAKADTELNKMRRPVEFDDVGGDDEL